MDNVTAKKFDLVVFGATGFTGNYMVEETAYIAGEENLTWAIAGRNMAKLQKVLSDASKKTGKNLEETPIIIADVSSPNSLDEMARQARVILNICGPYTLYGDAVIRACIEHGTHHLDLSGEQEFLEKTQLLYNAKARENNMLVIGAAGTGCVGSEAGMMFMQEKFKNGLLTSVEGFLNVEYGPLGGGLNAGTFDSIIRSWGRKKELEDVRRQLFPEPLKVAHKLPVRSSVSFCEETKQWCCPIAAVDNSVVERTVRDHLKTGVLKSPVEYFMYMCLPNWFAAWGTSLFTSILQFLSMFSFGQWFLLKIFNIKGPTRQQVEATKFCITFSGYGYGSLASAEAGEKPNRKVVAKLTGPEPFYISTSINLVQCAVTILKEPNSLNHKAGVVTPGAAFYGTNLIESLEKRGLKFTLISDSAA